LDLRVGNREFRKAAIQANQQIRKYPDGRFAQPLKTLKVDIDLSRKGPLIIGLAGYACHAGTPFGSNFTYILGRSRTKMPSVTNP
jgi:hypothetical protein